MTKPPAYQMYGRDFNQSCIHMSLAERGLYITLLNASWEMGGLPSEPRRICRIAACLPDEFEEAWETVSEKFVEGEDGKLRNARQEAYRDELQAYRDLQSEKGRRSAAARKAARKRSKSAGDSTERQPNANRNSTAVEPRLQPKSNRGTNRKGNRTSTGPPTERQPNFNSASASASESASAEETPQTPLRGDDQVEFSDPKLQSKWEEWLAYRRKDKRNSVTPTARSKQLKLLRGLSVERAMSALETSMTNGWTGIFPDKVPPCPTANNPRVSAGPDAEQAARNQALRQQVERLQEDMARRGAEAEALHGGGQ